MTPSRFLNPIPYPLVPIPPYNLRFDDFGRTGPGVRCSPQEFGIKGYRTCYAHTLVESFGESMSVGR